MKAARIWWGSAALALAVAATCALLLVVGRLPLAGDPLGARAWFAKVLVLHVDFSLLFWLLSACVVVWLVDKPVERVGRVGGWLAIAAAACAIAAAFGPGAVVTSNYVPVIDSAPFLGALAAFALAILLVAAPALRRFAAWPAGTAWAMAAFVAAAATALIDGNEARDLPAQSRWEATYWGAGHLLQFVYVLVLMRLWQRASESLGGEGDARFFKACYGLTGAFAVGGLALALWLDAGDSSSRWAWTALMAAGTWPGALAFFGLLFHRTVHRAAFIKQTGASALLFFAGIVLGALLSADNVSVPAHYHATVGAISLAVMAASPALAARAGMAWPTGRLSRMQPWLFAGGALLLVGGLGLNGMADLPRKAPGSASGFLAIALFASGGLLTVFAAFLYSGLAWSAMGAGRGATRPRDVRVRAAATAIVGVLTLGAIIAWWPQFPPPVEAASPASRHARDMKLREIEQRFAQGVVMLHARQHEHALTAFHRVLELDPAMPEAHVNAGFALFGMGRLDAARDFFQSAIELRGGQLNAYYGLALAYEALGDMQAARGAMRTYAHLAPADDPYRRKAEAALWEWESAGGR